MSCNFSIPFTGTADDLTNKAKNVIEQAGGTFTGNSISGSFYLNTPLGNITGTYTIDNQTLNIIITQKPFLISCDRIKTELEKYINQPLDPQ